MIVDFSEAALSMTIKGMKSYKRYGADAALIDPELGFVDGTSDDEVQKLFAKIGARMRRFVQGKVAMILLTGTRVSEGRFKATLKDALGGLVAPQALIGPGSPSFEGESADLDLVFATAKGAAEVAKRRLEGPVRCKWSEKCESLLAMRREMLKKERMEL